MNKRKLCDGNTHQFTSRLFALMASFRFPHNEQQHGWWHQHQPMASTDEETEIFLGLLYEKTLKKKITNLNINFPSVCVCVCACVLPGRQLVLSVPSASSTFFCSHVMVTFGYVAFTAIYWQSVTQHMRWNLVCCAQKWLYNFERFEKCILNSGY